MINFVINNIYNSIMDSLTKTEKIWRQLFGWFGFFMFIAATFKSFVTMFWVGKEVAQMGVFEIGFAAAGFVFALANRELGTLANAVGKKMTHK